jgi:lipid-A-disaccharide synthase
MPKRIMLIAGESSGDFHSASLIYALKEINPDIEISGIGGERMRRAGAKIYFDISELSIIGFTDVLKNLKKIKQVFNRLLEEIDSYKPQAVILVDYPGFNLKLAKELKKRGLTVIYYISPQIWAWWKGRIKTIRQYVDKMLVVFKFEEALYKDYGIDVSFVGHPLLDIAHPNIPREEFCTKLGLSAHHKIIGLVPGSRKMEVERILPILLESAKLIKQRLPQAQFALLQAPGLPDKVFTEAVAQSGISSVVTAGSPSASPRNDGCSRAPCENQTYDFLNACDFVLVASGTATLETAIMQKPMVVVYKVSFLNWLIARRLIKIPFIGLVNVVAQRLIVPEFIQYKAKPQAIAEYAWKILGSEQALTNVKSELKKVRQNLGTPGASRRAAQIILNVVG